MIGGNKRVVMARLLRVRYKGAIYHITVRSNSADRLFRSDQDRHYWLYRLGESAKLHEARIHLYCMMSNHFHLLVETPRANLDCFMHSLLTGYTVFFNRHHRQHGHVTQGRYGARLVSGDEYLLKLSRYVHLNPVKTKQERSRPLSERLTLLREYPWSSFRTYVGEAKAPSWLAMKPTLGLMGGWSDDRQRRYREYVEAGVAEDDEQFKAELMRSRHSIGDEDFRESVDERYAELAEKARRPEDASFREEGGKETSSETILGMVAKEAGVGIEALRARRRGTALKAVTAWLLGRYGGLTQRDMAPLLGLTSGSSVSCQMRRVPELLATDAGVKRLMARAERALAPGQRRNRR